MASAVIIGAGVGGLDRKHEAHLRYTILFGSEFDGLINAISNAEPFGSEFSLYLHSLSAVHVKTTARVAADNLVIWQAA